MLEHFLFQCYDTTTMYALFFELTMYNVILYFIDILQNRKKNVIVIFKVLKIGSQYSSRIQFNIFVFLFFFFFILDYFCLFI